MSETSTHPTSEPTDGVNLVQPQSESATPIADVAPAQVVQETPVESPHQQSQAPHYEVDEEHWTVLGETSKYVISALILIFGIVVAYFLSTLKKPPATGDENLLIPRVKLVEAAPFAGQLDRVISGTVVPYREIRVAAEVSGNVVEKYPAFEAGNFVNKGEPLLKIDATDYELMLETGLAEVDQSQKMLEETQEEVIGAQRNIKLSEKEYQLAIDENDRNIKIEGALSSSELDQSKRNLLSAETALTTRKNTLDMLNAKIKRMESALVLAKAQLKRTRLNLSKTLVVAPDHGVIVREMVQEGDYLRAGDPIVTFEDTSRSEVICNLTPTDLAWVRSNAPASSEFEKGADPNQEFSVYYLPKTKVSVYETGNDAVYWEGILERFDGIGRDESTRTIPCRITIENPIIQTELGPRALVRGMYVKCKIQVQTSADKAKRSFLSIPAVAVHPGNVVWIVRDEENKPVLKKMVVEVVDYAEQLVGEEVEKIVIISENEGSVRAGDRVVRTPLSQPSVDAEVEIEPPKDEDSDETTVAKKETGASEAESEIQ